jgi:hypothetical protein
MSTSFVIRLVLVGAALGVAMLAGFGPVAFAQEEGAEEEQPKELTIEELRKLIEQQQRLLEEQSRQIERQQEEIAAQRELLRSMQTQVDQLAEAQDQGLSEETVALRTRLEELEGVVKQEADAPTDIEADDEFPGSIRIPGTNARMKFGGWIKLSAVRTFDPLGTDDRFIVATIPTQEQVAGEDQRYTLSVRQSRFNVDVREMTAGGPLRAFWEADFAEEGDSFRLRHAYGQWKNVLAGQTWSTFVDDVAVPEEIDFEGLSGRINLRQPLVRYTTALGDFRLDVAIEDPEADITGGEGVSSLPSVVTRLRRTRENKHLQVALLLREIRGQADFNPVLTREAFGWAVSASRRMAVPLWDEKDNLTFQLNVGRGIGRYVNDLDSAEGMDGFFNEATGDLETVPVFAGYVAFQHWWKPRYRSTVVYNWVRVDNAGFQGDEAYKRTDRATLNLLFSPIPRIDLGGEVLWGERKDENGATGTAWQTQFAVKYKY